MKGQEGIGKSFISHATLRLLRSQEEGHASFAYFYFKEDFAHLQFAQCAFSSAAIQIAESNAKYAEQIAAKLKEDEPNTAQTPTWRRLFLSPFGTSNAADGNEKLFLVFDGLDESNDEQRQIFYNFLADLKKEKSRVHVLVTTRTGETAALEEYEPLVIEASMQGCYTSNTRYVDCLISGERAQLSELWTSFPTTFTICTRSCWTTVAAIARHSNTKLFASCSHG